MVVYARSSTMLPALPFKGRACSNHLSQAQQQGMVGFLTMRTLWSPQPGLWAMLQTVALNQDGQAP